MNRIERKFIDLKKAGKKAFIAFVTAGDPSLALTEELVFALERAGADIIELGVPFSDPMADGPTIQAASYRSLQRGTTLAKIFDLVERVRLKSDIPIALMTYYNPVFHYGEKKLIARAVKAGVDGFIIPDLPVEEAGVLRAEALKADIATIFFLAPTTTPSRIAPVASASTGFIYYVSVAGVTGATKAVPQTIASSICQVKKITGKPVCVGFGVSTPAEAVAIARAADGVIVGSAIVKEIDRHASSKDMTARVEAFVASLAKAVHG